jgi:hypothetical protein
LLENLPWPEVVQNPYYLQNLRAILYAAGDKQRIAAAPRACTAIHDEWLEIETALRNWKSGAIGANSRQHGP